MWDLQPRIWGEPDYLPGQQTKPRMLSVFTARIEQELKPEANAQAWLAGMHGLHEGVTQPGATELGHGIGECANAG